MANKSYEISRHIWPLPEGSASRGTVVLVHGLGEHIGRYGHIAKFLNDSHFNVVGYDLYGHGKSDGVRGSFRCSSQHLDDLVEVVDGARNAMPKYQPLLLLGHSMGGLIAARFVSLNLRPIDGLVLSSPALDPDLNAFQKLLLAVLPAILPNLRVGNGLNADFISHDAGVVAAYKNDPLVHDRISGLLAKFIAEAGPAVIAAAAYWAVPTLVLFAGQDKLVNPRGSRAFISKAPSSIVSSFYFEAMYHEIFNEPNAIEVFAQLEPWLDTRF
jgi:alpha-beta hydrolase superfamily lysophospholipase